MVSVSIFFFTVITDFADGLIARLRKEKTSIGKILDPLALKIVSGFVKEGEEIIINVEDQNITIKTFADLVEVKKEEKVYQKNYNCNYSKLFKCSDSL